MNFIKEDMKSLSLSRDQKDRLLEMCVKLFPKYKIIELKDADCGFGGTPHIDGTPYCGDGFDCYVGFSEMDVPRDDYTVIHWFEFCMTHLAIKAIPKFEKDSTEDDDRNDFDYDYSFMCNGFLYHKMELHPVDYLYKEFKNLK